MVEKVMKVNSSIYKGIQYVQINALPPDQKERLLNTINAELFIKILVDGKVIGNCLQFKDYEVWFENVFIGETATTRSSKTPHGAEDKKMISIS